MVDFFRAGGFNMFVLAALGVPTWIVATMFARNASPQRLSLIRALTWAIAFASIVGTAAGLAMTCLGVANLPAFDPRILCQGIAESLTNAILGFGILAIAWILVAVGVRQLKELP
jgi:hypothetical protein